MCCGRAAAVAASRGGLPGSQRHGWRTLVCTSQPDQISSTLSWAIPQLPGDPGATAQGVADGPKAILFRLASVGVSGLGQRAYEARWSGP